MRGLLLPAVVAAVGGLLLAVQLDTQTIHLSVGGDADAEAAYLGHARAAAPELWAADDALLTRAGLGLCAALERHPARVVEPRPVDGLTPRELWAVVDAATQNLCPAQRAKVATYLRRNSK